MDGTLTVGTIIFGGFILGELLSKLGFPRVTGYILAGIGLNPSLNPIVPQAVVDHSAVVTNISLAFITFSVGGTLYLPKLRKLGKSILTITAMESMGAYVAVALGFATLGPLVLHLPHGWLAGFLPMALLTGALAAPTDPSATLAVIHQFKVKGEVSSTIMGVAAFDDGAGILAYSLALAAADVLVSGSSFDPLTSLGEPLLAIFGAVALGVAFGALLDLMVRTVLRKDTEGALIVVVLGLLGLCFGAARAADLDELLATMSMGVVVANFCVKGEQVFSLLERYTEELVFVLFFTISGMHLQPGVLMDSWALVLLFVGLRMVGKISGTMLGAKISDAPSKVRRYAAGGLIPQGGIVIGLALLMRENPSFQEFSDILINVVLGATVLHEIIGPVIAKASLARAGELDAP